MLCVKVTQSLMLYPEERGAEHFHSGIDLRCLLVQCPHFAYLQGEAQSGERFVKAYIGSQTILHLPTCHLLSLVNCSLNSLPSSNNPLLKVQKRLIKILQFKLSLICISFSHNHNRLIWWERHSKGPRNQRIIIIKSKVFSLAVPMWYIPKRFCSHILGMADDGIKLSCLICVQMFSCTLSFTLCHAVSTVFSVWLHPINSASFRKMNKYIPSGLWMPLHNHMKSCFFGGNS